MKYGKVLGVAILFFTLFSSVLTAGVVPSKYISEVNESCGEEKAKEYKELASYFTDLVIEKKQKYIAMKLKSIFNNPGEKKAFDIFIKKLEKYSNGKQVSTKKINYLKKVLIGIKIAYDNRELALNNAKLSKKEQLDYYNNLISEKESLLSELKRSIQQSNGSIQQSKRSIQQSNGSIKETLEKIKILEDAIKDLKNDIAKLDGVNT